MMLSEIYLMEDGNMKKNNTDKIFEEYQKELKKLFEGKGTKSFDKMTGEVLDKLKEEVKKVAEATKKESKKKQ